MLKTGINFGKQGFELTDEALMAHIAAAGFDAFFTGFSADPHVTEELCRLAVQYGVFYESIHAPFGGISHIWQEDEKGAAWVNTLKQVVDTCRRFGIGYMTVHAANAPRYNNNGPHGSLYTELGAARFAQVAASAAEQGVKMAIENVEFPDREMVSLLAYLKEYAPREGFATLYDVGHFSCYPCALDFATAFGDCLVGTHVHDNFGIRDPRVITWEDDSHLLPFDGTIDYRAVGETLRRCHYQGTVTLEVSRGRAPLPWYEDYTPESFFATAHERALHVAQLAE